ncbi:MAG: hypothetical protein WAR39_02435 [Prevotella sp.]
MKVYTKIIDEKAKTVSISNRIELFNNPIKLNILKLVTYGSIKSIKEATIVIEIISFVERFPSPVLIAV